MQGYKIWIRPRFYHHQLKCHIPGITARTPNSAMMRIYNSQKQMLILSDNRNQNILTQHMTILDKMWYSSIPAKCVLTFCRDRLALATLPPLFPPPTGDVVTEPPVEDAGKGFLGLISLPPPVNIPIEGSPELGCDRAKGITADDIMLRRGLGEAEEGWLEVGGLAWPFVDRLGGVVGCQSDGRRRGNSCSQNRLPLRRR